jgi:quercetin dioxygenase-like cupin family protein
VQEERLVTESPYTSAEAVVIVDPDKAESRPAGGRSLIGTGKVVPLYTALGTSEVKLNAVYLDPGARFRPHWHPFDQILFYAYGTGVVAIDGGEDMIVPEGNYVVLPASTPHMHGCTDAGPALQLSIMRDTQTDFDGCPVPDAWKKWLA